VQRLELEQWCYEAGQLMQCIEADIGNGEEEQSGRVARRMLQLIFMSNEFFLV
jgi:hypothetical protein